MGALFLSYFTIYTKSMKHLKLFDQHAQYEVYINKEDAVFPNVSYCEDLKCLHFNKEKPIPPVPVQQNDEIWYTTASQQPIDLHMYDEALENATWYGPEIISNTYENGKGIIKFDDEIKKIGLWRDSDLGNVYNLLLPSIPDGQLNSDNIRTDITSISFPDSLEEIVWDDENAIFGLYNEYGFLCDSRQLQSVHFGKNIKKIGICTFKRCFRLEDINFPDSLEEICESAFEDCQSLEQAVLGDSVTTIGDYAFRYDVNLKEIKLPASLENMGSGVFQHCTFIPSELVNESSFNAEDENYWEADLGDEIINGTIVKEEGTVAVGYHGEDGNFILPATVSDILTTEHGTLFSLNPKIESISVESGNEFFVAENNGIYETYDEDKEHLMFACKNTIIPSSVIEIGEKCFMGRFDIETFVIPDNVEMVGQYCFANCFSLKEITIGTGIQEFNGLGSNLFTHDIDLKIINVLTITPPSFFDFYGDFVVKYIFVPSESFANYEVSDWARMGSTLRIYGSYTINLLNATDENLSITNDNVQRCIGINVGECKDFWEEDMSGHPYIITTDIDLKDLNDNIVYHSEEGESFYFNDIENLGDYDRQTLKLVKHD